MNRLFFYVSRKTSYEMLIWAWSSDVCSSDLLGLGHLGVGEDHDVAGDLPAHRAHARRPHRHHDLLQPRDDPGRGGAPARALRPRPPDPGALRPEERRAGKEGVRTGRSRWLPDP